MSILSPYLQRRGDTFSFRIAVPSELRQIVGKREFIKSLQTTDKRVAVVKALSLAATAKQLFYTLEQDMLKPENLRELLLVTRVKLEAREARQRLEDEREAEIDKAIREKKEIEEKARVEIERLSNVGRMGVLKYAYKAKALELELAKARSSNGSLPCSRVSEECSIRRTFRVLHIQHKIQQAEGRTWRKDIS